ncbi:hypothetical protein [Streptomyces sp. NPDC051000]|uniref:hypothetical protein n=1 Tax=Streptomyces sp. NPDC051000 TaxID=3155520 RepID=UPI0033CA0106
MSDGWGRFWPLEMVLRLEELLFPSIVAGAGSVMRGRRVGPALPAVRAALATVPDGQPKSAGVRPWPSSSLRTASR